MELPGQLQRRVQSALGDTHRILKSQVPEGAQPLPLGVASGAGMAGPGGRPAARRLASFTRSRFADRCAQCSWWDEGVAYERAGLADSALAAYRPLELDYYGRFVELWEEADPVLQPAVREVRGRMVTLAGEGK